MTGFASLFFILFSLSLGAAAGLEKTLMAKDFKLIRVRMASYDDPG